MLIAERMVKTEEDWHPNFQNNMLRLRLYRLNNNKGFRVCIWGADDTGMEKDFPYSVTGLEHAAYTFAAIVKYQPVTRYKLKRYDLRRA